MIGEITQQTYEVDEPEGDEGLTILSAVETAGCIALAGAVPNAKTEHGVIANSSDRIPKSIGTRRRGGYGFARHPESYPTKEVE